MNKRRHSGYTLIELLLVVAVIALIAALGVKTYRDKAQSDRLNIAALNIQHVLEAGMAYYAGQGSLWPKNNSACNATPQDTVFVQQYLPNQSSQSNLGPYLCWSGDDATKGEQKSNIFWVALPITAGDAQTAMDQAKRIAARLPNAVVMDSPVSTGTPTNTCTSTTCYVRAEVTIPSSSTTNNQPYLAGMGNCDPNGGGVGVKQVGSGQGPGDGSTANANSIICMRTSFGQQFNTSSFASDPSLSQYEVDFTCKPGETPHIYVVPNFFQQDGYSMTGSYQSNSIYQLSGAGSNDYTKDCYTNDSATTPDGNVKCTITMLATDRASQVSTGQQAQMIGCIDKYANAGFCICKSPPYDTKTQTGCPDKSGSIGATYMAMCVPATASPQAKNGSEEAYW